MKRAPQPPSTPAPEGDVRLDFEIHTEQRGAVDEWERRGAWLDHVRAHGEALAVLAMRGARDDAAAVQLTVDRFRKLLRQGKASKADPFGRPLDLASPLHGVQPWPPVFSGEPLSPDTEALLSSRFQWDRYDLPRWGRAVAHFAPAFMGRSSSTGRPSPLVVNLARQHLARLLDVARAALGYVEPAPVKKRAMKKKPRKK